MSKINAVRLVNINYNNNAIRISDECLYFQGESTLLSLRNGGGKSVLVQMMTAPFVHKRYRDAKDRPFESYFTTGKPSFILVEWALDAGAGYVLTGMMVRRNQDSDSENDEVLEIVNFISEYRSPCLQDIHHIPIVEKRDKELILKNFTACRQMFESYKKDRSMEFFYYDMANSAQSRQYFDKLKEYQIHYKEWETIIKKVNLKESGLSDLFSDCRDEKGLVEKWFLDAVESKLNKERNRMKEFQTILEKYIGQYKENQSKIQRRDRIRSFKEEAEPVREQAGRYLKEEDQVREKQAQIALLIRELNRLWNLDEESLKMLENHLEEIREKIQRIEYEKLSMELHELEQKLYYRVSNRDMLELEREELGREITRIRGCLHRLACAKQRGNLWEEQGEQERIRQQIQVFHQEEKELAPEREDLGRKLYRYYKRAAKENQRARRENQERLGELAQSMEEGRKKLSQLEQQILTEVSREGGLKSQVASYDQAEEQFCSRYGEELVRNILGEYEPGSLEIRKTGYEKELNDCIREWRKKKLSLESSKEKEKHLERQIRNLELEKVKKEQEQSQETERRQRFEKELDDRRVVLKYLELEEKDVFDLPKILAASERKLKELDSLRKNLEREEDQLQKEYRQLTQGKTLELGSEIEEELENLGLPVVYGMEWLQKNGYEEEKNRELVRANPFLPYGLILSGRELEKLSKHAGQVYTSFPVPIIVRERLEEKTTKEAEEEAGLPSAGSTSFYMLFNENLLNEAALGRLVKDKEQQIEKKQEAIGLRRTEYQEYFKRQEYVVNQSVNRESYEENQQKLADLKEELSGLEAQMKAGREEHGLLCQAIKNLEEELLSLSRRQEDQKRRLEEFCLLQKAYEQYEENRLELERCRHHREKLEQQKEVTAARLERIQDQQKTLEAEGNRLEQEGQVLRERENSYEKYQEDKAEEEETGQDEALKEEIKGSREEIQTMEARYAAITGRLSLKLQELEAEEARANTRCQKALEELQYLQEKYHLKEKDYQETVYDRKEEMHQESLLEDRERKDEKKQGLWMIEKTGIAALEQKKKDRQRKMLETCGKEEPLPKSEIQNQDFEARKNQLCYQEGEAKKQESALKERQRSYDENLTALAEYAQFQPGEASPAWEQDIASMTGKERRDFHGMMVRDYKAALGERQRAKERLDQMLNRMVRMDKFQDEFYRKPLEAMLELTGEAEHVLRQLSTTLQSYDSLMEKLEVDISLIEKEKEKIAELLEDYIHEVHQNLDRIDGNSTITIRERSVKMLKIQLPEWEENESLYHIRIQDMIEETTRKGLLILEKNENIQEYLGTRMTTRSLYDTVIGIGNVQIKLYKIEEQREYPITWAQVAKNSGGEGFLSAFVILSSLLYYMRKDEADIFADRNEGKVLLMDNPFAQTNAAHLLKPLMDMAKKTNTQLICLTGLGGESIYNRFDNIYILNLIAASLRSGMQYLKADHLRGNEPEVMEVSQIQVVEQMELVF